MKFYLAGLRLGEQILMNPHDFENKGKKYPAWSAALTQAAME
jgi:hypothetical protein